MPNTHYCAPPSSVTLYYADEPQDQPTDVGGVVWEGELAGAAAVARPDRVVVAYGDEDHEITDCYAVRGVVWEEGLTEGHVDQDVPEVTKHKHWTDDGPDDRSPPPPPPQTCYWVGSELRCC